MKISTTKNVCRIDQIAHGECFWYEGELYFSLVKNQEYIHLRTGEKINFTGAEICELAYVMVVNNNYRSDDDY